MKTRVGIVGPQDSVDLIYNVAEKYEEIISIPMAYKKVKDVSSLLQKEQHKADVWVFSGQVPYSLAKESGFIQQNAYFPELNGSSLIRTLLQMVYNDHLKLERLSFDTLSENDIRETLSELQLPFNDLYFNGYKGYKPIDELIDFHLTLFEENQVDACVTCLRAVYEELIKREVPAYRITPTRMAIRQVLDMAQQHGETLHFKKSQIAVHIIQVDESKKTVDKKRSAYEDYRLNLKLQDCLLEYAEEISGTLIPLGNSEFAIFSTRGSFEDNTTFHLKLLLEKIMFLTDLPIYIGIGYGRTSLTAEQNARIGVSHSQNSGGNGFILVDEYGTIEGPLNKESSLSFSFRTENKKIRDLLKKAAVSISTFNKLLSIQDKIDVINSVNLAEWLGTTQRNARRILSNLEKQGLAEVIGEESPATTGRPRKNYRINHLI